MSMQYGFKVRFSDHIMEDNIGQLICTDVILAREGTYEYTSDDVFDDGKFHIVELHRDWEDVKKLKYTPNAVARGLASKKTTTIGIVLPDIADLSSAEIVSGIESVANMYKYNIIFLSNLIEIIE